MSEHHLPWVYRPRHFDDWGWIRDFAGNIAAIARGDDGSKSHDQHRSDKTDPYGEYAAFIVKAVNNHDALVSALKECAIRLRYDGDLFRDQGNEMRRDASWKAQEMAEAVLVLVGGPGHE
jgi:hypothetical protein